MIAFVETTPAVDMHGEHFLITFDSGGSEIKMMLTTKAFRTMIARCNRASDDRAEADLKVREKLIPFPQGKGRRAKI